MNYPSMHCGKHFTCDSRHWHRRTASAFICIYRNFLPLFFGLLSNAERKRNVAIPGRKIRRLCYDTSMNIIATEGTHMNQVDVHDLPEEQAQMVQAFVDFLRSQMKKQTGETQQVATPFSVWNLGTKSNLSRTEIYERV